jgi:hypothetical protein
MLANRSGICLANSETGQAPVEDVWRMGQGTMTGINGPSRSSSIRSMTSVDERDEQVLKHRLLDGMQEARGSNPLSSTLPSTPFLQLSRDGY